LGERAIDSLCEFMTGKCELLRINLEANFLGDKVIIKLCETINKTLSEKLLLLNLGQNNISDIGARRVASSIESCKLLQVLILYWNKISNTGGANIIRVMKNHAHLRIFDISWNIIGDSLLEKPSVDDMINSINSINSINTINNTLKSPDNKPEKNLFNVTLSGMRSSMSMDLAKLRLNPAKKVSEFANELGEYFSESNTFLIHLDISHNNISSEDAKLISKYKSYK